MVYTLYLYEALKITHDKGIEYIKLNTEYSYIDENEYQIEDLVNIKNNENVIYRRGLSLFEPDFLILIKEKIKENININYKSKNKYLQNNYFNSIFDSGESLKSINDIIELSIVQLHECIN